MFGAVLSPLRLSPLRLGGVAPARERRAVLKVEARPDKGGQRLVRARAIGLPGHDILLVGQVFDARKNIHRFTELNVAGKVNN